MKSLICFLAVLANFSTAFAEDTSLTKKLDLLLFDYTCQKTWDLSEVKGLIQAGADVNAPGPNGGNSLNIAVESWAYMSHDVEGVDFPSLCNATHSVAGKNVIKLLLESGADANNADNRGFTPLMHLVRYGPKDISEIFDLLMSKNPDLNKVNLAEGISLTYYLTLGSRPRELEIALKKGLNLMLVGYNGQSIAHRAARSVPKEGQPPLLKKLLELVPQPQRAELATKTDSTGNTPALWAIRSKNVAALEYLLNDFKADLMNTRTVNDETALSLALESNDRKIIDLVKSSGGQTIPMTTQIDCQNSFVGDLDFEKLVQIIQSCNIKRIEDLLPLTPRPLRSNYILAYNTLALQGASPAFPQAILFGRDGKMMLAFNGHESQNAFHNLEIIQFRDKTKQFEMRDIEFPEDTVGVVKISRENPGKCLRCHGSSPRPLWDNWFFWPGKFQSEQASFYPSELSFYQQFLKNRQSGRYQHLLPQSSSPIITGLGKMDVAATPGSKLDALVADLIGEKVVEDLRHEKILAPFRYAVLAALSCRDSIDGYLPPAIRAGMPFAPADLLSQTIEDSKAEFNARVSRLEGLIGSKPQGRYVNDQVLFPKYYSYEFVGVNSEVKRVARLRYIFDGLGVSMRSWFSQFDTNHTRYVSFSLGPVEARAWSALLSPQEDADLWKLFEAEFKRINGSGDPFKMVYNRKAEPVICPLLKQKSLAELSL